MFKHNPMKNYKAPVFIRKVWFCKEEEGEISRERQMVKDGEINRNEIKLEKSKE